MDWRWNDAHNMYRETISSEEYLRNLSTKFQFNFSTSYRKLFKSVKRKIHLVLCSLLILCSKNRCYELFYRKSDLSTMRNYPYPMEYFLINQLFQLLINKILWIFQIIWMYAIIWWRHGTTLYSSMAVYIPKHTLNTVEQNWKIISRICMPITR